MTQRDSKDVADALAAMSAGHHPEPHADDPKNDSVHESPAPSAAPSNAPPSRAPASKPRPTAPQPTPPLVKKSPRPNSPPPSPASPITPAAPVRPRPTAPGVPTSDAYASPSPALPPRPAAPVRPPAPQISEYQDESAEQFTAPSDAAISSSYAEAIANISTQDPTASNAEDDQAVLAPAPSVEVFRGSRRPKKDPLKMRRTMIPLLITMGLMMPIIAIITLTSQDDSPQMQIITKPGAYGLFAAGLISLALAAMNMMFVKTELAKRV